MKLITSIIAAAMMIWATISAQAAEMPSQTVMAKSELGLGGSAIPGAAFGKASVEEKIQLAQRRRGRGFRGARRGGGVVRRGRSRRRGRRFRRGAAIVGAAALIAGAIAASQANSGPRYGGGYCRRMWRRCRRGNDWACDRFEDRCD